MLVKELMDILGEMDPNESIRGVHYKTDDEFISLLDGKTTCIIPTDSVHLSDTLLTTSSTLIALPHQKRTVLGIWAQDKNGLIGKNNKLPWKNAADMKFFKETIKGKIIVMGRTTSENVGNLPSKHRIVFSKTTPEAVLSTTNEDLVVCGGSKTYDAFAPYYTHLYITTIDGGYEGDSFIPESIDLNDYSLVETIPIENGTIRTYARNE